MATHLVGTGSLVGQTVTLASSVDRRPRSAVEWRSSFARQVSLRLCVRDEACRPELHPVCPEGHRRVCARPGGNEDYLLPVPLGDG